MHWTIIEIIEIIKTYNNAFGLSNTGNHLYPLLIKNRDEFLIKMKTVGIQCAIHYLPLHLMKGYKFLNTSSLPNTEFIGKHCVSIPLHAELKNEEIEYVIHHVRLYAKFIELQMR
jgi:dTDP-4-amino-4,6-dideoxygalactose transaminase